MIIDFLETIYYQNYYQLNVDLTNKIILDKDNSVVSFTVIMGWVVPVLIAVVILVIALLGFVNHWICPKVIVNLSCKCLQSKNVCSIALEAMIPTLKQLLLCQTWNNRLRMRNPRQRRD